MKAIIRTQESNGRNYADTKETILELRVIARRSEHAAYEPRKLCEVVTARFYMGRSRNASTVYCSVWVHCEGIHTAGHGTAGGWGYHKNSAALSAALTSAGVELWGSPYDKEDEDTNEGQRAYISGCGDSAMRSALLAVARATGADCSEYLIV